MNAIFYIARTGCQWKALPRSFGASSTVHDRFQEWRQDGVFKRMRIDGLKIYDKKVGINWKWQSYNIKCEYLNPLIRMGLVGCETNLTQIIIFTSTLLQWDMFYRNYFSFYRW
jgi:hypothetical protein